MSKRLGIEVQDHDKKQGFWYGTKGEISDGYHTFNELYEFRMLYNAAFFNELHRRWGVSVVKSWRHSDGELCFGGGWFVVSTELPTGQITNHYEAKHWDLFRVPEVDKAPEWDGHTPQDVAQRLRDYLLVKATAPKPREGGKDD